MKTAVILAGGLGTRLRAVVHDVPKPMAPIHGRPFLAHQLDYWIAQGIERFVLSVGYKHDLIRNFFGSVYQGVPLEYVIEQTPMGTGGGFLLALKHLGTDAPFLLLNGDTYFDVDLTKLIAFSADHQADWVFSLFRTQDTDRYLGMDVAKDGQIRSFKSRAGSVALANGGVYWINPRAIPTSCFEQWAGPVSLEQDIFPAALAAGNRFFGFEHSGTFIDIGLPDDYHRSALIIEG